MAYLSEAALATLGLRKTGRNVRVSDRAAIHNPGAISLGNHVRIDDFCVLSPGPGGIELGSYVHIAVFCSLIGREAIVLEDFAALSGHVSVYSSSDDYSGAALSNPTVPDEYKAVHHAPVRLKRHVIVGAGSVILPGVTLGTGVAVGALSLVDRSLPEFSVCFGTPARRVGERKRDLLELERRLRAQEG